MEKIIHIELFLRQVDRNELLLGKTDFAQTWGFSRRKMKAYFFKNSR